MAKKLGSAPNGSPLETHHVDVQRFWMILVALMFYKYLITVNMYAYLCVQYWQILWQGTAYCVFFVGNMSHLFAM